MKKSVKTLIVLGASVMLLGSQVCFAGNQSRKTNQTSTTNMNQAGGNGTMNRKTTQTRTSSTVRSTTQTQSQSGSK